MKIPFTILIILQWLASFQGGLGPFGHHAQFTVNNWNCYNSLAWDSIEDLTGNTFYNDAYESLTDDEKEEVKIHLSELGQVVMCHSDAGNLRIELDQNLKILSYRQCFKDIKSENGWICDDFYKYSASQKVDY